MHDAVPSGNLVLSRRKGERLVIDIGGGIWIEVVEINGQSVRIGIRAARQVPIYREEVYLARQEQSGDEKIREAAEELRNWHDLTTDMGEPHA